MMKRLGLFALAVLLLCAGSRTSAQVGAVASVRREKNPWQYSFGAFSTLLSFTGSSNNDTLIPPSLQSTVNDFSSTSSFSVTRGGTPPTFTVSGNVGTLSSSGTVGATYGSTGSSFASPLAFVTLTINQTGTTTGGSYNNIGVSIVSATSSVELDATYNQKSGACSIVLDQSGTDHTLSSTSCTPPAGTWKIGLSLVGNQATTWLYNGTGWAPEGTGSTSAYYNFETNGNMTGLMAGMFFYTQNATITSWQISNLNTGLPGGVGIRDVAPVTLPDGRIYFNGTNMYATGYLWTAGGSGLGSSCGVFEINPSAATAAQIGSIMLNRGTATYPDDCDGMVYDPTSGKQYLNMGTWSTDSTSTVQTWYTETLISNDDLLGSGIHVVGGNFLVSFAGTTTGTYDTRMFCDQWNYSAGTCSHWLMHYVGSSVLKMVESSSDPSANSWSAVGSAVSGEWNAMNRVSSGSNQVKYFHIAGLGPGTDNETVFDSTVAQVGWLNLSTVGVGMNLVPFGNTMYIVSYNGGSFTGGDLLITSSPRYTGIPAFELASVPESGSAAIASISSSTVSVDKGRIIAVTCRAGALASGTISVSSVPSASWGNAVSLPGTSTSSPMVMAYATAPADRMSFTCTPSSSAGYQSMSAFEIPNATGLDPNASATWSGQTTTAATSLTSGSFSTTNASTGILCITPYSINGGFTTGNMAGSLATMVANSQGDMACEARQLSTAVSGQTATINWYSSVGNAAVFAAFDTQ